MLESMQKGEQTNITNRLLLYFGWWDYFDQCSCVWFSLTIENETFESTAILLSNLRTGVHEAHHAEHSSTTQIPPLTSE